MKIAILAYGSIIRNLQNRYSESTLTIKDDFQESGFTIPTSFHDISSKHLPNESRICLLANSQPSEIVRPTKVYYATHESEDLDHALDNFMKREGTDDPSHVALFKHPNNTESSSYCSLSFGEEHVQEIENWLKKNEYDFALIAQFPSRPSLEELQLFVTQDDEIKKRTLIYFLGLPEPTQEAHRDALELLGFDFNKFLEEAS